MYHVVHETRLDFEGFISTRHNKLTTIHHGRSLSWRAYKKISIRLLSAMIILSISFSYVIARTLRFYVTKLFSNLHVPTRVTDTLCYKKLISSSYV